MPYGAAGSVITGSPPACRVTKSTTTSVNSGTQTAVAFDTETFDNNTMHDPVTNNSRITFSTPGVYVVIGFVAWQLSGAGTYRQAKIVLNGATDLAIATASAATLSANTGYEVVASAIYKFAANDYVEIQVKQDSGGALTVQTNSVFTAGWIGLGT